MKTFHPISALTSLRSLPFVPALALAAVLVGLAPAAQAQLPNAWQISDNSPGGFLNYTNILGSNQQMEATDLTGGFDFAVNARFTTNFSGSTTMYMSYDLGGRRFLIYWDLNGNSDLRAQLEVGGPAFILTTNGTGTALYHTHEIVYNPTHNTASYVFDGQVLTNNWAPHASTSPAGTISWGAGSSAGQGQMNFHSVSFAAASLGVVAAYDAGTSPTNAPDPASQGWVLSPSSPPPGSTNAISPDTALLPVATTLAADQLADTSARLNGQANARGSPTLAWFEWGTDTNYGNMTAMQEVGRGLSVSNLSVVLGGRQGGLDYHYRLVASNAFGVVVGTDQSFNLSFLLTTIPGLPGVDTCSAAWGDYDKDGRLDLLLAGEGANGLITEVWWNTGNGFTNINAGLPGVVACSVAWGDYDNDGRLDVLLAGQDINLNLITQVWRNTGSGFSKINAGLPGVKVCSVAWGDYDNDGRLDILLAGEGANGSITEVWRNTGGGFTNINAGLPGIELCSVAWGDYDNDGRLDILLAGVAANGRITEVWRNTGSGFTNINAGLPGIGDPNLGGGSVAWGDYDNDGRLNILLAGYGANGPMTQVWRNNAQFSNAPPVAPTGLSGTASGSTVTLNWTAPTDDHTPVAGLGYNVRIGTTPGASDVLSPMALTNGLRLLPALGNAQAGTNALYDLRQLTPGRDYYWSVQAVDSSFAGSPFAAEAAFAISPRLINPIQYSSGVFEFYYTNRSLLVTNYAVLASTNLALPVADWTRLGSALPLGNGLYRFTDIRATGQPQRFYQLVGP